MIVVIIIDTSIIEQYGVTIYFIGSTCFGYEEADASYHKLVIGFEL